ncbi:MAG: amino acid permease, partial [Pyrinomonadaceae bacterium]
QGTTMGTVLAIFPTIIKVGAVLGLSSTMVVMTMGQPRIFYSMSKDGLLPSWAAKVHPKYRTPHITTAITGIIVAILGGFVPISLLGELVSIGTLFAFVIVGTGIIILRSSNPALNRPFKVPFSPYIPIGCVVSAAYLMNNLPPDTWIRLIDWMAIGLVVYFGYSFTHSKLGADPDATSDALPADYKPPVAAIIGIALVIILTIFQVHYWIDFKELLKLPPGQPLPEYTEALNMALRLFAWILTGVLIWMLMYGKRDEGTSRNSATRSRGLIISVVNLLIWAAITAWYFMYVHVSPAAAM